MKYSKLTFATTLLAIFISSSLCPAQPKLELEKAGNDTVYRARHYVLGLTDPGNIASIDGKTVKVYRTGAFGAEVNLKTGNNRIDVMVVDGNGTSRMETLNIFRAEKRPEKIRKFTLEEAQREMDFHSGKELDLYGTTKPGAFLQWGDGSDRLGGSKIGYLDEGITLHLISWKEGLYKVGLSSGRFAFIPEQYVETGAEKVEAVNTGSWNITNTGSRDRVSISLPRRLPYAAWTQLDPTTICADLYGAMNNSNWITQRSKTSMIEYVDWRQVDSDVMRVIIKLKEPFFWGFSAGYEGNNFVITVRHRPNLTLNGLKIGLDAGHGGKSSPGAISFTGIEEKTVNLDIVLRLKKLLESKGAVVVLSRDSDKEVSMSERRRIFKEADVDLMISVHNNAGGSPVTTMGTSTYYKHIANRTLAECMLTRMTGLGLKNAGLTGNFNFALGTPTDYPNCLVEGLFMSSLPEEELIADPAFRQKMAEGILGGIEDYLKLVKKSL